MANHLAGWCATTISIVAMLMDSHRVVSLVICFDRPLHRLKQVAKFIDVARVLREFNNYSALRAIWAGINQCMTSKMTRMLGTMFPDHAKSLNSWDLLLRHVNSHHTYRLALESSEACIPALYVSSTCGETFLITSNRSVKSTSQISSQPIKGMLTASLNAPT